MKLAIADKLSLPADAVTQTFAILAKRGVGKTYTAAVFAEELLSAGLRTVIVDPVGVWWGLRAGADGKQSGGLPIIVMGGDHADIPLEKTGGELVADFIVDTGRSVILDLSLFRKGEQTQFMTAFAETLYRRNRDPLQLIVDEADAFAPQRPIKGSERLLGAMEDLVRRGRARGLGVTLVTQRAAVLNKNVLTQIEVLVCLRTIAPQDRAAIDEWIKVHGTPEEREEMMGSLASLEIGEAWFWSPAWLDIFQRVKVRARRTFDSSSTPKAGARKTQQSLAPVDLDDLRGKMEATIERAKAEDPRELRRRIAELEKQVKVLESTKAARAKIERKEVPILTDKQIGRLEKLADYFEFLFSREGQRIVDPIRKTLATLQSSHLSATARPGQSGVPSLVKNQGGALRPLGNAPRKIESMENARPGPKAGVTVGETAQSIGAGETKIHIKAGAIASGGMRRMMIALAQRPGLNAKQLGVRAGLSSSSGTFGTYLGKLRSNGWAEGDRQSMQLTAAGVEALGTFDPLPTGPELLGYWLGQLGNSGAGRMLSALAEAYPKALTKEQLGEQASISHQSGTFSTYLGKLRTLELVNGTREIRASEEFFD